MVHKRYLCEVRTCTHFHIILFVFVFCSPYSAKLTVKHVQYVCSPHSVLCEMLVIFDLLLLWLLNTLHVLSPVIALSPSQLHP